MPGRLVIDRPGVIRVAGLVPDSTTRPEPAETVQALRGLAGDVRKTVTV